jgi:DTW domain-containing protein YfiP
MHPKEWRREKCATGRLACLNLANSEIIPGVAFDELPRLRSLCANPDNLPLLLYPGEGAFDLSAGGFPEELRAELSAIPGGRSLLVFLVDATWSCAKTILRRSPGLLALPRLMFSPKSGSRFTIKRQPEPWCLSTLEAIHELLLALDAVGLDAYPDRERLLATFHAMQDYQVLRQGAARETMETRGLSSVRLSRSHRGR